MTKTELQIRLDLFERELKRLRSIGVGCQSCEHYRNGGQCERWNSQPPPEVMQQGCDDWSYDFVPF